MADEPGVLETNKVFDAIQVLSQYRDGLLTRDEAEKCLVQADPLTLSDNGWKGLLDFINAPPDILADLNTGLNAATDEEAAASIK